MMARRNEQSAKDKAKATAKESEEKKAAARLESENEAEVEAMKEAEKKDREQAALEKKTREMPKEKAKKDEVNATIVAKEVPGESGAGAPAVDFDPSKSMVQPPPPPNLTMLHVARSLAAPPPARSLRAGARATAALPRRTGRKPRLVPLLCRSARARPSLTHTH